MSAALGGGQVVLPAFFFVLDSNALFSSVWAISGTTHNLHVYELGLIGKGHNDADRKDVFRFMVFPVLR